MSMKVLVCIDPATGPDFTVMAIHDLTTGGYEIEVVAAMPIEPLPKMEPLEPFKPKCYGRQQSKNISRWR